VIHSLDELRKLAVKYILRQGPADYLLRQSLCKPWVASEHLDEMAWTDFKRLFFNFPKLRAQLDAWDAGQTVAANLSATNGTHTKLDPGDHGTAFLAAACHEILHVLWLHKYRQKGKAIEQWKAACEYAINFELSNIFGMAWIEHLGVMYPPAGLLKALRENDLPTTTDGFYEALLKEPSFMMNVPKIIVCKFCDRVGSPTEEELEEDPLDRVRVLHQLPIDAREREDILKFLIAEQAPSQRIPWETLLMGGIEDAVTKEQSWMRPSRRDDMLPSWRHEKLLTFVWILDVSPSIDEDMKRSFMNTLQAGINLYHDSQHRVIFFADSIEADIMVSSGTNLSRMEIPEGSGTDLTDVWKVLEDDRPEYALVLSDLELQCEVPKPSYTKIIWGIVNNIRNFDPDYGVKIELKD
jgi:hypothetical protein